MSRKTGGGAGFFRFRWPSRIGRWILIARAATNRTPPVGTGRPLRMLEVRPVQPMVELAFQSESVLSRSGRLKQEGLAKPDLALQYSRQISLGAADALAPLVIWLEAD